MLESARFAFRAWKYRFWNERAELAYLRQQVHRGSIAVDIGAHKGAYLYWLRKLVGPQGQVFAFEPQPKLANYLRGEVKRMGWTNVIVENMGVSSQSGSMPLFVPAGKDGASPSASLSTHASSSSESVIDVEVVSLDHYFQTRGIHRIDVLKCDVEGHELEVFRGGRKLLEVSKPTLLFECESRHHHDGNISPVLEFLQQLGFEGQFFLGGRVFPLEQFDPAAHQSQQTERFWESDDYCNNFVFERKAA